MPFRLLLSNIYYAILDLMKKATQDQIPATPKQQLKIWGKMLAAARREKRWRQADVAERLNVTRQTIARVERGDPNVSIGHYMTLAWVLNVPVLASLETFEQSTKLPKRIQKKPEKPIDDNF